MRFNVDTLTVGLLLLTSTPAIAHPQPISDLQAVSEPLSERAEHEFADISDLWKRKGGGGGGGRGGGGSSGGGSSSGGSSSGGSSSGGKPSSGGSSSGGSSSGGSSTNTGGRGSPNSNTGGSTRQGSGVQPSYGGGRYYGGGATAPFASGAALRTGILAVGLGAGAGALLAYPWHYPYGANVYPYTHPYYFINHTRNNTNTKRDYVWLSDLVQRQDTGGVNETKPVQCLCAMNVECGCDDNGNQTWFQELVGDGTYANLNKSLIDVATVNGTDTIIINGTLPDGTTTSGGTEDADVTDNAANGMYQASGWGVMAAIVACTVLLV